MQHAIKTTLISIAHLVREEMTASTARTNQSKAETIEGHLWGV